MVALFDRNATQSGERCPYFLFPLVSNAFLRVSPKILLYQLQCIFVACIMNKITWAARQEKCSKTEKNVFQNVWRLNLWGPVYQNSLNFPKAGPGIVRMETIDLRTAI